MDEDARDAYIRAAVEAAPILSESQIATLNRVFVSAGSDNAKE